MPELRARSRTPSTSRAGPASPEKPSSPRKGAPEPAGNCCIQFWTKFSPQRRQQIITAAWFLLAMLVVAGGLCTVQHRVDVKLPLPSLSERMAFTFRCLLLSGVTLALAVKYVIYKRFTTSAISPLSGNDRVIEVPARILQNTLEQFVLHTCVVLALASYLNAEQMKYIPLLCAYFILGRFFFFLGYPSKRCFGFALTWIPTGLAIWANFYFMYTRGFTGFEKATPAGL